MKYLFSILLFTQIVSGQDIKAPGVLILTPVEFVLDESLKSEASVYEGTMTDSQVKECISIKNEYVDREHVMKMNEVECEFTRNSDIIKAFTFYTYGWLTFKLSGPFKDAITYPVNHKLKRDLDEYEALANEYDINWVVNLKQVLFQKDSKELSGEVTIEIWNKNVGEIIQIETIEVDAVNRGMEMSCEDGKLGCLVTNGAIFTVTKVLNTMYSEEKYWR